jgi:hypothetical protein
MPDDLYVQVVGIARDTSRTLGQTISDLIRRGLGQGIEVKTSISARTGLQVLHLGKVITTEDIRRLEDDDK